MLLNGVPRSGKSSIAAAIRESYDGASVGLGVDAQRMSIPDRYQPGIGLRPGGERPDLEPFVVAMYAALFDSIAAHSRAGLRTVVDVGVHDGYSKPLGILVDAARRLAGLPAWLIGVHCPLEVIMARRDGDPGATAYLATSADGSVPVAARRWQEAVHDPGIYDFAVDTSLMTAAECAAAIRVHMAEGAPPMALRRIADRP